MSRLRCYKNKFAYIIVLGIFIFSILCWIGFYKNISNTANLTTKEDKMEDVHNPIDLLIGSVDLIWSKSVFLKEFLSAIDVKYTYYMTGEIASTRVLKGEDGWLFYKSAMGDFTGENSFSDNEKYATLVSAEELQKSLNERGIESVIIIPPNKENVYYEYVPDSYIHTESSRTDDIIDYLSNNGINIITPKEQLLKSEIDKPLYYKYDTHWNQLGAYIGVQMIVDNWNLAIPSLSKREINARRLANEYHYCAEDDLAQMIGLRERVYNDEIEYTIRNALELNWKEYERQQESGEISFFHHDKALTHNSVLLVGDSFRSAMIPALCETFSDVFVVHRDNFNPTMLDDIKPQYVIIEYVERYSYELKDINELINEQ